MFQEDADCVTAQFTSNNDGSLNIVNRGRLLNNGSNVVSTGRATLQFGDEVPLLGFLNVTFPGMSESKF